ncbi:unnamed protein product, partial [marine sediment metagenome]
TGIFELVKASDKGILVFGDNIPVFPESQKLCDEFGLDFLSTITSGTLLVAADPSNAEKILRLYKKNNLRAAKIGKIKEKDYGLKIMRKNNVSNLNFSEKDEITRLFE